MNLKQSLDKFAKSLIDKASKDDTPLSESTDAFKAVTAYYAAQQRSRKKSGDDDPPPDSDEFSFANGVGGENGGSGSKISTRRNS